MYESSASPVAGGEMLLWPPVTGPTGVLLRHAIRTDDGRKDDDSPQAPWLVHADGHIRRLPFVLGVSPLVALDDDRWLLPGFNAVWRDGYDEPLSVLDAKGAIEPLLVGGREVPVSRILHEAAPELLASLGPVDLSLEVPWQPVSARLEAASDTLLIAIEVSPSTRTT